MIYSDNGGTLNYMNQNLDMKGQAISNACQLSALTCVDTPTLRATSIVFSDVEHSGQLIVLIK